MQASRFSFITREDTLLGVCASLGEDFGFNPFYLRAAFGVLLLWNPVVVLSTYALGFAVVLASRILYPTAVAAQIDETPVLPLHAQNDPEQLELAVAA